MKFRNFKRALVCACAVLFAVALCASVGQAQTSDSSPKRVLESLFGGKAEKSKLENVVNDLLKSLNAPKQALQQETEEPRVWVETWWLRIGPLKTKLGWEINFNQAALTDLVTAGELIANLPLPGEVKLAIKAAATGARVISKGQGIVFRVPFSIKPVIPLPR